MLGCLIAYLYHPIISLSDNHNTVWLLTFVHTLKLTTLKKIHFFFLWIKLLLLIFYYKLGNTQPNQIRSLPFCACAPVRGTWVSTCMPKRLETTITFNFSAMCCLLFLVYSPRIWMQHINSFYFATGCVLTSWNQHINYHMVPQQHHVMELRDGWVVKGHTVILWTD